MRVAALLPFGDPQASDNWQVMKNPQVQILPKPSLVTTRPPPPTPDPSDPVITGLNRPSKPVETQKPQKV